MSIFIINVLLFAATSCLALYIVIRNDQPRKVNRQADDLKTIGLSDRAEQARELISLFREAKPVPPTEQEWDNAFRS